MISVSDSATVWNIVQGEEMFHKVTLASYFLLGHIVFQQMTTMSGTEDNVFWISVLAESRTALEQRTGQLANKLRLSCDVF